MQKDGGKGLGEHVMINIKNSIFRVIPNLLSCQGLKEKLGTYVLSVQDILAPLAQLSIHTGNRE